MVWLLLVKMENKPLKTYGLSFILICVSIVLMLLPWSLPMVFSPGPDQISVDYTSFLNFSVITWGDFLPPFCFVLTVVWVVLTHISPPRVWPRFLFGTLSTLMCILRIFHHSFSIVVPWFIILISVLLILALILQIVQAKQNS